MAAAKSTRQPSYRRHKASGQAVVTLGGKDHYLGKHGTAASRRAYDRLMAEWLTNGRQVAAGAPKTVQEVMAAFLKHAQAYYRHKDGTPTGEAQEALYSLRPLRHLYGTLPAIEFGPLKLKAVRQLMVDGYDHPRYGPQSSLARGVINQRIGRITRMFRWAAAEEMLPVAVYQSLRTVEGLKQGRSEARETEPIRPVADAVVDATRPFLSRHVRAMVDLQRLTGARPGEVCGIRPADINRSGAVWVARLDTHKNTHRGHVREIYFGPKAQEVLQPFLDGRDDAAFVFSPRDVVAEREASLRAARKSKVQPSQLCRKKRKPKRKAGERYKVLTYRRAITRACEQAFPLPGPLSRQEGETIAQWEARLTPEQRAEAKAWHSEHAWHPHQLRHTAATHIRREFGVELARIILGHKNGFTTEIYAEADKAKAVGAVALVG